MEELKAVGETTQFIVIKLGDEQYGIDIKYIDNIVRMQHITRVILRGSSISCLRRHWKNAALP